MAYSDFEKAYKFSIRDDTSLFFQNSGPAPEPSPLSLTKVTIVNNCGYESYLYGAMVVDNQIAFFTGDMASGETKIVDVVLFNGIGFVNTSSFNQVEVTGNIVLEGNIITVTGPGTITMLEVEGPGEK